MKQLRRIKFTQEGYDDLQQEQARLKIERKDALESLKKARELGDLSENGLYKGARMRLTGIDHRLRRIAFELKLAEIVDRPTGDTVAIGTAVKLDEKGQTIRYEIVGDLEANPVEGKISLNSPIGRAISGKKIGDVVIVEAPNKKRELKIISIT